MKTIKIKFWGVRGSTPSPAKEYLKYGGNTACLEIKTDDELIICDAGTGIRQLGKSLVKKHKSINAHILISHLHLDHISGLPFFEPLYNNKNTFHIIGPNINKKSFSKSIITALSPPFFPVKITQDGASIKFKSVHEKSFNIGKVRVIPLKLKHPGICLGWRFNFPSGKSIVYVSDNEPGRNFDKIVKWAHKTDLIIHDAQYTPKEYLTHKGWGHSPYTYASKIAKEAKIPRVILSHFDPDYSDTFLKKLELKVTRLNKDIKSKFAHEGLTLNI